MAILTSIKPHKKINFITTILDFVTTKYVLTGVQLWLFYFLREIVMVFGAYLLILLFVPVLSLIGCFSGFVLTKAVYNWMFTDFSELN
ncbi:hypothetical protein [Pseudoalteromonas denitrificans]|jgi:hypothetical protein|uniref:Uncharacterized protein n=1 Tax=Pseudoalteromonas denitrificans DSM 6059 TaxID=1123010 RepID=A0A1I1GUX2_9GAMM|nr:hypothetical protein [Pseudoalteromonas denitrificans]SFC15266.1 hypothetical protein SAMN02745724_01037 [Pseudoalteromonas denitrificans DSM 6059]